MKFRWDENKNAINKAKHGISFETAKLVFNDPFHISIQDRHENGEERWQTLGLINGLAVICLVPKLRLGMPTFKLCLMLLIVHATPSRAW
jgi:uncharacterized DUF497 family protein